MTKGMILIAVISLLTGYAVGIFAGYRLFRNAARIGMSDMKLLVDEMMKRQKEEEQQ